jgi:hypothetical protein
MSKIGIIAALDVTPQGVVCPDGWVQVSRAEGTAQTIQFDANFYASEQAFDQGALPLLTRSFTIPYQSGDLVTILHTHLLTLNLDDTSNANPYSRLRCNLTTGTLVNRTDNEEASAPDNPNASDANEETPNNSPTDTESSPENTEPSDAQAGG